MRGFVVPSWFYIFTGGVLVASGAAQLFLRARAEGVRGFAKPGALFSVLSLCIGLLVVYYGLFIHRHR